MGAKNQATLGSFFGGRNGPAVQQKLSFATRTKPDAEPHDEDPQSDQENVKLENGNASTSASDSDVTSVPRKRNHSKYVIEADDDDEPIAKKPKNSKTKHTQATNGDSVAASPKEFPSDADDKPIKTEPLSKEEEEEAEVEEAEEEEDLAPEAREEVQAALKSSKHPYPDWKKGDPAPYAALCTTFSLIELTTKRLIILSHCSLFLRQVVRLTPDDLLPTVLLMINKLASDYAGIELGIGESLVMKAIGEATGRSLQVVKDDHNTIGDLGLVAAKSRMNQRTMFAPKPLTIRGVHQTLLSIATMSGSGAQGNKVKAMNKLLGAADAHMPKGAKTDITVDKGGPSEAKFLVRSFEGKLRLGLAERTVLVALAQAMVYHEAQQKGSKDPSPEKVAKGEAILRQVYSELPSYELVIPALLEHGISNLQEYCKLQAGVPLKPMLAKPTKSITEVLNRFENKEFTCEYKYDGERAQIHFVSKKSDYQPIVPGSLPPKKADGLSAIFSRNSEDLSKKYPDVLAKIEGWLAPGTESFVLDCETVAWDVTEKKILPFQQLMTRKRKDVKVEDVKVKVCIFAFDLLFLNGESVVKKPLRERRELMFKALTPLEGEFAFATSMNSSVIDEIQHFLDDSVKGQCEGLMVKMLDGEESGYEPSKRSRNWLKVKKDYLSGVGDSLDLVVLGAYYGKGKRTSWYGAFLLACYNPTSEIYETVCNIGTGFSEAQLDEFHKALSPHAIAKPKPFYSHSVGNKDQPDVWFEPKFVWEVKTADLTLSPRYVAGKGLGVDPAGERGVSLRFPRFLNTREDKKPEMATTNRAIVEMYRKQESVNANRGPAVDDDFEY